MPVQIDVWSDFVCPYCFAAEVNLKVLEESHGAAVHWRSFELRPQGTPPPSPEVRARIDAARLRFVQSMWEQYGLEIHAGPFGINSRPALIGEKYAICQGVGDLYHQAVTRAYWLEGRSIDDRGLLREIAEAVGLEGAAFLKALDEPSYSRMVDGDIAEAARYGLKAVPALVFAHKYLISGSQPYEVLAQVVEQFEGKNNSL